MEQTYHGKVEGRTIQLDDDVKLPRGTEVVVTLRVARKGTPASVLAAAAEEPHISADDVNELLAVIRAHKKPASYEDPFKGFLEDVEELDEAE